ncbi:MAG: class I SAM-dependent methyltransferase [Myxococcales bacterium]|nr:class I SAM-dependent methyltransferase [Myxococcales bacterium]
MLIGELPDEGIPIMNPLAAQPLHEIRFHVDGESGFYLTDPQCLVGLPAVDLSFHSSRSSLRAEIAAMLERQAKLVNELRDRLQKLSFDVARQDQLARVHATLDLEHVGRVRVEADEDGVRMIDCRRIPGGTPASMGGRVLDIDQFADPWLLKAHLARLTEKALGEREAAPDARSRPSRLADWMDKTWYPHHADNWDDTLFREVIEAHIRPDFRVLDLGAGAGIIPAMNFRGAVARVCGVDPTPRVHDNPYLDEAKEGFGEEIPYPGDSFDLVFSDNVLEHLPDPDAVFCEIHRVLKPGGLLLAKTPNRRHYVATIARMTPHWVHQFVNALRGRAQEDTFPTRYRANTPEAIAGIAARTGFRVQECRIVEGRPEYLRLSPITYVFGWLYERLVNATPRLERFRVVIVAVLQKHGAASV